MENPKIFTLVKKAENKTHDRPLVLVHGSWGASWMWKKYIAFFSQNGWDVYALDLRGHGQSEGTVNGATMSDYARDVTQAIKDNNLENPIIIGHSMGGLVVLMSASENSAVAVVSINPSQSKEAQGEGEEKEYPAEYTPMEAGMPADPMEAMRAFPDLPKEMLMKMREMLGKESGVARSDRKRGVPVSKESLPMPVLFVGGDYEDAVAFGIGAKKTKVMADLYEKDFVEVAGASHPGILMGENAEAAMNKINEWLSDK